MLRYRRRDFGRRAFVGVDVEMDSGATEEGQCHLIHAPGALTMYMEHSDPYPLTIALIFSRDNSTEYDLDNPLLPSAKSPLKYNVVITCNDVVISNEITHNRS